MPKVIIAPFRFFWCLSLFLLGAMDGLILQPASASVSTPSTSSSSSSSASAPVQRTYPLAQALRNVTAPTDLIIYYAGEDIYFIFVPSEQGQDIMDQWQLITRHNLPRYARCILLQYWGNSTIYKGARYANNFHKHAGDYHFMPTIMINLIPLSSSFSSLTDQNLLTDFSDFLTKHYNDYKSLTSTPSNAIFTAQPVTLKTLGAPPPDPNLCATPPQPVQ